MARSHLILSDVDGTIVRGSLILDHAGFLHNTGIIDFGDLYDRWNADKKNEHLLSELAETYREKTAGMTVRNLGATLFARRYAASARNLYRSTWHTLLSSLRSGGEIHLVSGSPSYLVIPFAQGLEKQARLSGKNVRIVGHGSLYLTDNQGKLTGHIQGLYGAEAKRQAVTRILTGFSARTGIGSPTVSSFGDTLSDLPLLQAANSGAYLVDPHAHTVRSYRQHDVVFSVLR